MSQMSRDDMHRRSPLDSSSEVSAFELAPGVQRSVRGANLQLELLTPESLVKCAQMMSQSLPWVVYGYTEAECRSKISEPPARTIVAIRDNTAIGFITVVPREIASCPGVSLLCIAESERGQGIGTVLLAEAERFLFKNDVNVCLTMSVLPNEKDSAGQPTGRALRLRNFYEHRGYTQVGSLPSYNLPGQDELLFRKTRGPRRSSF